MRHLLTIALLLFLYTDQKLWSSWILFCHTYNGRLVCFCGHSLITHTSSRNNKKTDSAYLKDPPSGYHEPAIDIFAAFAAIKAKINGTYANEHEFQEDLFLTFASVHDGHFRFSPDGLTRALSFGRTVPIVSVSSDGVELPKVYSYGKLNSQGARLNH